MRFAAARACVLAFALGTSFEARADDAVEDDPLPQGADRLPLLIEALQSSSSFKVRATAAIAMGRLGDARAATPLGNALAVDENYAVRVAAAGALGKLPSEASIQALLAALNDADGLVQDEATLALERLALVRFSGVYREALKAEDPVRRLAAVKALGVTLRDGDSSAGPALLEAIADEDPKVSQAAERLLSGLAPNRAAPILLEGLSTGSAAVRLTCARMLTKRPNAAAVPLLVTTATSTSESEDVRLAARDALRAHRSFLDIKAALAAATDKAPKAREPRAAALRLLGAVGDPGAIEVSLTALGDADVQVRTAAARALVDLGGPRAKTALVGAHDKERDPRVQRQLELLLKQLHSLP